MSPRALETHLGALMRQTRRMQQVVVASDETLTCDNRSHRRLRTQAFAVDRLCDNELDWSS